MLESKLQSWAIKFLKRKGFYAVKLAQRYHRGWPDLMVIAYASPFACVFFIELKCPGKSLSGIQIVMHHILDQLNCPVYTARNHEDIEKICTEVSCRIKQK